MLCWGAFWLIPPYSGLACLQPDGTWWSREFFYPLLIFLQVISSRRDKTINSHSSRSRGRMSSVTRELCVWQTLLLCGSWSEAKGDRCQRTFLWKVNLKWKWTLGNLLHWSVQSADVNSRPSSRAAVRLDARIENGHQRVFFWFPFQTLSLVYVCGPSGVNELNKHIVVMPRESFEVTIWAWNNGSA